jgi:cytoskeleton protein RodZ
VKSILRPRSGIKRVGPRAAPPVRPARRQDENRRDDRIDPARPSAVDTRALAVAAKLSSPTMEKEHFGNVLRRARESRGMALSDVARQTKIARSMLELLEKGELDDLPTGVYARGFIRSFARAVGSDENQSLLLYERAVEARSAAEKTRSATPVPDPPPELAAGATEDESLAPRRGLGLAVFVIILLLIATITLSLLLRRPPPSGEGLSLAPGAPSPGLAVIGPVAATPDRGARAPRSGTESLRGC